jgi:murein DD-endopeptidase MepM/ murein hydrolase activator NlpD
VDALAAKQAAVVEERRRLQDRTTLLQAQAADAAALIVTHQEAAQHRKRELEAARAEQAAARAELAAEADLEQRLLAQVQARRADYQSRILQLEQESSDIAALLRRHQADQTITPSGKGVLGSPLASPIVTSTYGYRLHPIFGDRRLHAGIDLRAATGTPVYASGSGVVVWAGHRGGYGNTVVLAHGGSLATLYAHNSELLVASGDTVRRGQLIARAGSTGNSTGPHLHFEVRVGGTPVDPLRYL